MSEETDYFIKLYFKLCLFPFLICIRRGNYSSQNGHVGPTVLPRGSSQSRHHVNSLTWISSMGHFKVIKLHVEKKEWPLDFSLFL